MPNELITNKPRVNLHYAREKGLDIMTKKEFSFRLFGL